MSTHHPTKEQEKAFKSIERAFKRAKKLGLVFYGKSSSIVAYTKEADNYIEQDFDGSLGTGLNQVPYISGDGLINDSGADDYGQYRSYEDQKNYDG